MDALLRIEEFKEREEAGRLADQLRILDEKSLKLSEFRKYLGEYNDSFATHARAGVRAGQIRSSYAFICQLNAAIAQQELIVSEAQRIVEEFRQQWLEAKIRVDILRKTRERMRREELDIENRREQALADEVAVRKHRLS